ncbi:MAG: gfo/Idh/MocA family oxidoreductase [Rhodobacteraceae bacterium CG17_big_fil_post_rev_8_21_14_2_50_65_11]|nr:MAG: gfo/Idh/MocA family oxidoreductase [Rhodobacteraceae bacterium CG17_big_fil_post_rev_8_21_14_2_50_65_11]
MIRVAIIGAGIGAEHLLGYRALPDRFRVAAMCDLDTARAEAATGGDAGIAISGDLEAVLADASVDLIDICLPPHLHFPVAVQALEAGKHVICEKPIVRSLDEADRLQAAAEVSGKSVFPVFQYRYGHAMAQLIALQAAGLTGKPYVASLETHWNRGADYYAVPWRGTWSGESGGALLGHAIHAHDLLCHVLGPVAEVTALTDTRVNAIETEDCAALALRMENGALATSSVTLGAGEDTTRLRFCFEGLSAESGSAPYAPAEDIWRFIARAPVTQAEVDAVLAKVPQGHAGFAGYLDAIADALSGRGGREVTLQDGRRSIELVTAIYQSAHDGGPKPLPVSRESAFYEGWIPDQP